MYREIFSVDRSSVNTASDNVGWLRQLTETRKKKPRKVSAVGWRAGGKTCDSIPPTVTSAGLGDRGAVFVPVGKGCWRCAARSLLDDAS